MRGLRTVHAIIVIQCGVVLAMVLFGSPGLAIAALAIVTIMLTWSIEKLRTAIQSRPENRS